MDSILKPGQRIVLMWCGEQRKGIVFATTPGLRVKIVGHSKPVPFEAANVVRVGW